MSCRRLILKTNMNAFRATATTRRALSSSSSSIPAWATADPKAMGVDSEPYAVKNLVSGNWETGSSTSTTIAVPHPLDANAPPIFTIPDTQVSELDPFLESLRKVSKSGVHNPLKNPERYVHYGEISRQVSEKIKHNNIVYIVKEGECRLNACNINISI